ncbi:MAG TPA: hypothetical protein DDW65_06410 [Firmicutes bacterium]|jgi:hypothetical protein|nr:hypothetical protein [Bacillota bacterium]
MVKLAPPKIKSKKDPYWRGLRTGVFIGCFFGCLAIMLLIGFQGIRIGINPEQLALLVQTRVKSEAGQEIPRILEEIKSDLPRQLPDHLTVLDQLTIGFGNSQVKLPAELVSTMKTELNRIFETILINTLNNYNTTAYQDLVAKNAYEMVRNTLKQEIIGKKYSVKFSPWFSIPITVVSSSKIKNPFQMGI